MNCDNAGKNSLIRWSRLLLTELRPRQWTKNLLVFGALLFSFPIATPAMFLRAFIGFVLFCLISGCVYIFNDFSDREADRRHPEKQHRPMASGALNPYLGLAFGCILLLGAIFTAFWVDIDFGILLAAYFVMNMAYTFHLKHVVILDVMIIAAGFVFRAIGGALVVDLPFTPWFLMCAMWLALFLAISKRRHEMRLMSAGNGLLPAGPESSRRVLAFYTAELLNQLISVVTTATIISYSLFTFTSGHTLLLMWTIPLVMYGMFRYLYLVYVEELGGRPEEVLLGDVHISGTVIAFAVAVAVILGCLE
ncbi:MAG TPA: decaprenyl-phosphate phosphoribosyltransferase [Patescibacteria group bacterium]|nr:decaprenyl-phosphate phosphoribosyltransferase [Patescibacteria group bacterium]